MAGGTREANIAFQAAEAGLRGAELAIEGTLSVQSIATMGNGWLTAAPASLEPDFFAGVTWDIAAPGFDGDSSAVNVAYPELGALGSRYQPRYVIKHVGDVADDATEKQAIAIGGYAQGGVLPRTAVFRVTARGTSRDGSAETILQSYFGKVYE